MPVENENQSEHEKTAVAYTRNHLCTTQQSCSDLPFEDRFGGEFEATTGRAE